MSKELEGIDLVISFLEGAIEFEKQFIQKTLSISERQFHNGKLEALNQTLEESKMIKSNFKQ